VPTLDADEQRTLVTVARVARLATLRADGTARLVPITFVLLDGLVCSAVDDVKPKRSMQLARLADVRRDPRAAVLVDHYAEDWTQLWWVRIDGTAAVHEAGELADRARTALAEKYPPYATAPPGGSVLVLTPHRWAGWRGSAPPPP
jgi:PPOX class probable F420-dependent enzyme